MNDLGLDIDDDWDNFCQEGSLTAFKDDNENSMRNAPKGTDLYISTKTKITYLSSPINLNEVFWKIDILPYYKPEIGVIKKQMKFNFVDENDLIKTKNKLKELHNVDDMTITEIINPTGRIKFKVIKKISIGICSKDITSSRSKKRGAFYNCFVIILRVKENDVFKEIHVKIFNTGKLEIPGIRDDKLLINVMNQVLDILVPITGIKDLKYDMSHTDTVLINSNFNSGYYINREKLFNILKYKYKINSIFDPCSYPGIQCKYNIDNIKKVSFMIFRTGSVLIVGKCCEKKLYLIYEYIKQILIDEYSEINIKNIDTHETCQKINKIKKKTVYIS